MRLRPATVPALRPAVAGVLALILLAIGGTGAVQAQDVAFQSVRSSPDAPVTVTSDELSVDQGTGIAIFTGNVIVVQEGLRLNADKVTVDYVQGDRTQISTMTADGNVVMVSPTEAAQGNHAVYDVPGGTVVMTGDVLLTQGPNIMSGPKLTVDLRSGTGRMEGGGGRVRTVLQPGAQGSTP
ncbi:lipopolysaccharide transport periplasmic protein LptA [Paenirhodobacter populi]|uniref:Lipopolysaccharide transport periplasmic protein LptA n=1 Tax=Paenirhodobacter populi TaxID=2306993 RepID=A0A443JMI2_9RHOB|nr:lipopolysaccharide transport periplasmic protein LptA [Sinirhodobacter populi]RWR21711.1 lipopolysaccharide transport periplasmic protein LptA [Sinirhodobacter populi]